MIKRQHIDCDRLNMCNKSLQLTFHRYETSVLVSPALYLDSECQFYLVVVFVNEAFVMKLEPKHSADCLT